MSFEKFCETCPKKAHCCIFTGDAGFTFLSVADAKRIAKKTKKQFNEFVEYSALSRKSIAALRLDDVVDEGALRLSQMDSKHQILRLKKQKNGKCIFLSDAGKCTIYAIRPKICQIYPFWAVRLLSGKIKVYSHDHLSCCPIIISLVGKRQNHVDVAKCLSAAKMRAIEKTFVEIEKEDSNYRRDITKFIKLI